MKKFLSVLMLAAIIFFCGQNNFANAQDVYAGNTGGLDFYVDTNSITPTGSMVRVEYTVLFTST